MEIPATARNFGRFLMGTWADPVAKGVYNARKNKHVPTSIMSLVGDEYTKYWEHFDRLAPIEKNTTSIMEKVATEAVDTFKKANPKASPKEKLQAVKKALKGIHSQCTDTLSKAGVDMTTDANKRAFVEVQKKVAEKTANAGIFSKIGKFLGKIPGAKWVGKRFFPLLFAAQAIHGFISGYKEGGIAEGLKEGSRGLISMVGFSVATVLIGGTIGLTGIPLMIAAGLLSGFVFDKAINFALGPSVAEKKAMLAENEKQNNSQQQNFGTLAGRNRYYNNRSLASFGGYSDAQLKANMRAIDNMMKTTDTFFNNRHNIYTA